MPHASAPAKLILCGEHAVVYGRPAIAVPLSAVRASAEVCPGTAGSGLHLLAPDLGAAWIAADVPDNPLSELARTALARFGHANLDLSVTLRSAIPIASGMGSGAAIATALVRALAAAVGATPDPAEISMMVYASEQRFHGTPSGIDNTVVAFEQAIWFVRSRLAQTDAPPLAPLIEPISVGTPLTLVIGDTGVRSATRLPVAAVRAAWEADLPTYEGYFDAIGTLVTQARSALTTGDAPTLGHLLDTNQALLEQLGVSSPELERLIQVARQAGALGAKLSGAGWGGVMLALTTPSSAPTIAAALTNAGATHVFITELNESIISP